MTASGAEKMMIQGAVSKLSIREEPRHTSSPSDKH
jgi:hypothetical protein